ncbi:MAG: 50S ribosomal protein L25 [Bacteroidota bacterium]
MSEISIQAKRRTVNTKGTVKGLRREGKLPGIFYVKGEEPIPITVDEKALKPLVYTSKTHIIDLKIDDTDVKKSILKDVQFDPLTDKIVHFDLLGISLDKEIEIEVPVILEGQAKGIKEGGIIQHSMHKLHVACLPGNIPQHIALDVSNLGVGDSIHVGDLSLEKMKILNNPDVVIVAVVIPRAIVETPVAAETTTEEKAEPEVISKGKATEEEE